jgi:hypothetical protein
MDDNFLFNINICEMKKGTQDKIEKRFPMGEWQEDSSFPGKADADRKKKYPWPEGKDKQDKNQPEFIESQGNKKTT